MDWIYNKIVGKDSNNKNDLDIIISVSNDDNDSKLFEEGKVNKKRKRGRGKKKDEQSTLSNANVEINYEEEENMGEDDDKEDEEEIEICEDLNDLSKERGGKSHSKAIATAERHFMKFLEFQINKCCEVSGQCSIIKNKLETNKKSLNKNDLSLNIFGFFSDYLIKNTNIKKCASTLNYLSGIKTYFEMISPEISVFLNNEVLTSYAYRKLRTSICKKYIEFASKNNGSFADKAIPMTVEDLKIMTNILFNHRELDVAIENRCILIFQWQVMGRITEVLSLKKNSVTFSSDTDKSRSLKIVIKRTKTIKEQVLNEFFYFYFIY